MNPVQLALRWYDLISTMNFTQFIYNLRIPEFISKITGQVQALVFKLLFWNRTLDRKNNNFNSSNNLS